jgi:hypothetical protein
MDDHQISDFFVYGVVHSRVLSNFIYLKGRERKEERNKMEAKEYGEMKK